MREFGRISVVFGFYLGEKEVFDLFVFDSVAEKDEFFLFVGMKISKFYLMDSC